MKKLLLALSISVLSVCVASAQTPAPQPQGADKPAPKFEFTGGDTNDIGNVTDQKDAKYTFQFKNAGTAPLIIKKVSSSGSGAFPTSWSKEPIAPGKTGQIQGIFHTKGRPGPFDAILYIQSNAPSNIPPFGQYEIHIKGTVTPGAPAGSNTTTTSKG